jgi:hypothetical protein
MWLYKDALECYFKICKKKQVSRDSGLAHKIQNRRTITVKLQD